jgi:ribose 5-phosphate isomerase B
MIPKVVAIGADHAGYELKGVLTRDLDEMGVEVLDFGAKSSDPIDYPDAGHAVASAVANGGVGLGVLICGTGLGMTIAANRHPRVRAALCRSAEDAEMARRHNDANVLALGARTTTSATARECLKVFMTADFEGGRHARRVAKLG